MWGCGFEYRLWHRCLSLVSVVCCQVVEVTASGSSLVQRSPNECGVSECDREASITKIHARTHIHKILKQLY